MYHPVGEILMKGGSYGGDISQADKNLTEADIPLMQT